MFELDVTVPEQAAATRDAVAEKWGRVDGVLHAIGFAPESCLGDDFMDAPWDDVAVAMHISTYSLKVLAETFLPLMSEGGSIVGLDFDNQQAWPAYNWMGVAKSALQSWLPRQGTRPPTDPLQPGRRRPGEHDGRQVDPRLQAVRRHLGRPAPLGWDVNNAEPVAKAVVALLSDWFPATTGEIIHVDGGYHAVGA